MQTLPHQYSVTAKGDSLGALTAYCDNLPDIAVAPPAQFGGDGDKWSPEDLFMAAIANCFVLSFRAIARASKLEWQDIKCESQGTLDRVQGKTYFTQVQTKVQLMIPKTESIEKAEKLLNRADEACLISNSISCEMSLECDVVVQ